MFGTLRSYSRSFLFFFVTNDWEKVHHLSYMIYQEGTTRASCCSTWQIWIVGNHIGKHFLVHEERSFSPQPLTVQRTVIMRKCSLGNTHQREYMCTVIGELKRVVLKAKSNHNAPFNLVSHFSKKFRTTYTYVPLGKTVRLSLHNSFMAWWSEPYVWLDLS